MAALWCAVGIGLWRLAPVMAPVKPGTSAGFWLAACGVELESQWPGDLRGTYPPREGWFIYYIQGYHDQFLYRVPDEEVEADVPRVRDELEAQLERGKLSQGMAEAYRAWITRNAGEQTADKLLGCIHKVRLKRAEQRGPDSLQWLLEDEERFDFRWCRAKQYWVNIAFEFLYLSGLILFMLWPWLRGRGLLSWCIHIALLPLLLMLPYYLGYAQWTFTSAGPSGGVLYPWVIVWFWYGPWLEVDTVLLQMLLQMVPQVLEPISQTQGPMPSCTGGTTYGPVCAGVLGAVSVLYVLAFWFVRRLQPALKPWEWVIVILGFAVIPCVAAAVYVMQRLSRKRGGRNRAGDSPEPTKGREYESRREH